VLGYCREEKNRGRHEQDEVEGTGRRGCDIKKEKI